MSEAPYLVSVRGEKLQTPDPEGGYQLGQAVNRPLLARAAGVVSRSPTILVPKGSADGDPRWRKVNDQPIDEHEVLTYQAPWTRAQGQKSREWADVVVLAADPNDPTSTPGIFLGGEGIYAEELKETAMRWAEKQRKRRKEREEKFKHLWFNTKDGLLVRLGEALDKQMTRHRRAHRTNPARNDLPAGYYTGKKAI